MRRDRASFTASVKSVSRGNSMAGAHWSQPACLGSSTQLAGHWRGEPLSPRLRLTQGRPLLSRSPSLRPGLVPWPARPCSWSTALTSQLLARRRSRCESRREFPGVFSECPGRVWRVPGPWQRQLAQPLGRCRVVVSSSEAVTAEDTSWGPWGTSLVCPSSSASSAVCGVLG